MLEKLNDFHFQSKNDNYIRVKRSTTLIFNKDFEQNSMISIKCGVMLNEKKNREMNCHHRKH